MKGNSPNFKTGLENVIRVLSRRLSSTDFSPQKCFFHTENGPLFLRLIGWNMMRSAAFLVICDSIPGHLG